MLRDEATIIDILQAARLAVEFKNGIDIEAFLSDFKTQKSILHELLIIGEAVKRLSGNFRAQHPTIEWKEIAGMRDKLIHEYNTVDLEDVWKTVEIDLPILIRYLEDVTPGSDLKSFV